MELRFTKSDKHKHQCHKKITRKRRVKSHSQLIKKYMKYNTFDM